MASADSVHVIKGKQVVEEMLVAIRKRQPDEPAPLDCAIGLINSSIISLLLWAILYLLYRMW